MARPVLEVRDLWVQRGGRDVCRGVGLRAEPGEVVAVVGGRGAGKSALLSCLALDLRPSAGSVLLHGVDIAGADGERRAALRNRVIATVRVGWDNADGEVTGPGTWLVREPAHVALGAALSGPFDVVLVDGAFDLDGVGGATAGHDDLAGRQLALMQALLRRRSARPPAVLVASRNPAPLAAVADTVVVLDDGAVVDSGPVTHVLGGPRWADMVEVAGRRSA